MSSLNNTHRPDGNGPGVTSPNALPVSKSPYQKANASIALYNGATDWQLLLEKNEESCRFDPGGRWQKDNIEVLLPDGNIWMDELDYPASCLTIEEWWHHEDPDNGEYGNACRRVLSGLAKLPNPLLVKTFIRLYGAECLQLTEDGRLRCRLVDLCEMHGALWPSPYREGLKKKIRAAESITQLMAAE